jgi:hypothetical protein
MTLEVRVLAAAFASVMGVSFRNLGERLILRDHTAICREEARNPGYHSRNVASHSPLNTRVRICSRRCAPRGVQAICWRVQKRLLTI